MRWQTTATGVRTSVSLSIGMTPAHCNTNQQRGSIHLQAGNRWQIQSTGERTSVSQSIGMTPAHCLGSISPGSHTGLQQQAIERSYVSEYLLLPFQTWTVHTWAARALGSHIGSDAL